MGLIAIEKGIRKTKDGGINKILSKDLRIKVLWI